MISEIENGRRSAPAERVVHSIAEALSANQATASQLLRLAAAERRTTIGTRLPKSTPKHVRALVHELARLSGTLSPECAEAVMAVIQKGHAM